MDDSRLYIRCILNHLLVTNVTDVTWGSPFSWNNYNILGQFSQLLNVDIKRTNDQWGGGGYERCGLTLQEVYVTVD